MSWRDQSPEALARSRSTALARQRALSRLAIEFPEDFERLAAEERGKLGLPPAYKPRPDRCGSRKTEEQWPCWCDGDPSCNAIVDKPGTLCGPCRHSGHGVLPGGAHLAEMA